MKDGCNIFSKELLDIKQVIQILGLDPNDVMYMEDVEDWLKKENESIVIEFNGLLDDEDDEYPGYYYYNITFFEYGIKDKFKKLANKDIIVDMGEVEY